MIDMSTWEELVVDVVHDLRLDPHNVRLGLEAPERVPESDIVQDLFSNEKALSLVESIVKVGLLTHEVPIVVRRGNQLVVIEGNRRVAALKQFRTPTPLQSTRRVSPDSLKSSFSGIHCGRLLSSELQTKMRRTSSLRHFIQGISDCPGRQLVRPLSSRRRSTPERRPSSSFPSTRRSM